jgi:hypothetical protein
MVLVQPCPKPGPPVYRCHASIGGTIGLVVPKVVDRCHQVGGRQEVLHVQLDRSIEDGLYLAVVNNDMFRKSWSFGNF